MSMLATAALLLALAPAHKTALPFIDDDYGMARATIETALKTRPTTAQVTSGGGEHATGSLFGCDDPRRIRCWSQG